MSTPADLALGHAGSQDGRNPCAEPVQHGSRHHVGGKSRQSGAANQVDAGSSPSTARRPGGRRRPGRPRSTRTSTARRGTRLSVRARASTGGWQHYSGRGRGCGGRPGRGSCARNGPPTATRRGQVLGRRERSPREGRPARRQAARRRRDRPIQWGGRSRLRQPARKWKGTRKATGERHGHGAIASTRQSRAALGSAKPLDPGARALQPPASSATIVAQPVMDARMVRARRPELVD